MWQCIFEISFAFSVALNISQYLVNRKLTKASENLVYQAERLKEAYNTLLDTKDRIINSQADYIQQLTNRLEEIQLKINKLKWPNWPNM